LRRPSTATGDDKSFGAQLRLRRERAGFTLKECAAIAHYSESYLSRIENDKRPPLPHVVERLDQALDADGALLAIFTARTSRATSLDDPPDQPARAGARPGTSAQHEYRSEHGVQFDTLIRNGDSLHAAGNMDAASERYLAAFRATTDPRARAEAVIRLARRWSAPGQIDHDILYLINSARDALDSDTSPEAGHLRLRLLAHQAKKLSFAVSPAARPPGTAHDHGAHLAHHTLRTTGRENPDTVRCEVLTECRWALFDHEPAARLLPLSLALDEAASRAQQPHFQGEALIALAVDHLRVGHVSNALATIERHRTHAARHRGALTQWQQCTLDTLMDLWDGNFASAADWVFGESQKIVSALEQEMQTPADTLNQTRMGQAFWLLREQGRLNDLFTSDLIADVRRHAFSPIWHVGLVLALTETGQWRDATDQLLAFLETSDALSTLPPSGWSIPTLTLLAEACATIVGHGETDPNIVAALSLIDTRLAPHDTDIALAGWPTVMIGPVARVRGMMALASGDGDGARDAFRRAARSVRSSPPMMARLRVDQARALLVQPGADSRQAAVQMLTDALTAAQNLGMAALASQARALQADVTNLRLP
jgi:transcriptional regulator with XRE-family HTH domain